MTNIKNYIAEIEKRIKKVEQKEFLFHAAKGLLFSVFISAIVLFIFVLSQLFGNISPTVRTMQFYFFISSSLLSVIILFLFPFLKSQFLINKPKYFFTSEKIGNNFPQIKDDLKNSLQLLNEKNKGYSESLINASFKIVYEKCKSLDFQSIISFKLLKPQFFRTLGSIIILATVLSVFTGLNDALYKLINYDKEFKVPAKFTFTVEPGNRTITKGDFVDIRIKTIGEAPSGITLNIKNVDETDFALSELVKDSSGIFHHRINNVNSSFKYFAAAENISSDVFEISVINRPIISSFELRVIPPAYSGLSPVVQKDNGNFSALKGSSVKVGLNSTKKLSRAEILFNNRTDITMDFSGNEASVKLSVYKDLSYSFNIADTLGNGNSNPITYNISIFEDDNPAIVMLVPDEDTKLKNNDKQPLVVKISDDYGFTKLKLSYRLSESQYETPQTEFTNVEIPFNKKIKENDIYYTWDLVPLTLATNDVVSYYLEVFDNDFVSGPKSAKTPVFKISVPSLDELFAEADETQEVVKDDLFETLKEAQELKDEFDKISNELKKDSKEIDWQEKENIENALEKFEQLQDKIDDVSKKMSDMQKELQDNNLLSKETMEKYMELQKLFEEMKGNDMLDAMKKMQDMLKDMKRDDVKASFEDLKKNEDAFEKSIERTLNLMKRIQVEQKTDEINKRIEDLKESQENLREETEKSDLANKETKEKLQNQQKEISDKVENLKEEMSDLEKKMSEMKDMPQDQMEKMNQEMENQKNEELSKKAIEEMQQMQKAQAMQQMNKIEENMQQMQESMDAMQNSMDQQNALKTYSDMMKITNSLLQLSKEQEKLNDETDKLSSNSPQLQDKARKQSDIKNDLGKTISQMSELAQKSFTISPEMGKALGKSRQEMDKAISGMQNQPGQKSSFSKSMNLSMSGINEAAVMMKNAMDQIMNGGGQGQGSGGMMSLMQQLQNFSKQQMALNQMTQALQQGGKQQDQLQRLSEQQELLRKSLEQLNKESKESGQSKKLAGNLDKVLDDMMEVVSGLRTEKLNDDLVQTQERILNKLLDAQRSINERDFEKDRKSFAGKNIFRESPPEVLFKTEEGRNKLRDELMKAIKEGYLKDYEELIRNYFDVLEKSKEKISN
ncbi:MAG: hypothetical protein JEY94_09810 [Melioribacteraceae bacterium]|nr:hypothetical protein [Melioribacteraceae bacterium]